MEVPKASRGNTLGKIHRVTSAHWPSNWSFCPQHIENRVWSILWHLRRQHPVWSRSSNKRKGNRNVDGQRWRRNCIFRHTSWHRHRNLPWRTWSCISLKIWWAVGIVYWKWWLVQDWRACCQQCGEVGSSEPKIGTSHVSVEQRRLKANQDADELQDPKDNTTRKVSDARWTHLSIRLRLQQDAILSGVCTFGYQGLRRRQAWSTCQVSRRVWFIRSR